MRKANVKRWTGTLAALAISPLLTNCAAPISAADTYCERTRVIRMNDDQITETIISLNLWRPLVIQIDAHNAERKKHCPK